MEILGFLNRLSNSSRLFILSALTFVILGSYSAFAQDVVTAEHAVFVANNIWMMVATFLVFIMHLGFATLEAGLVRAKNTVNILFKNTFIISMSLLTYALMGFNLMYPGDFTIGQFFGFAGMGLASPEGADGLIAYADGGYSYWTDFLFQGMFAATAATIVSGAVAERIKLGSFFVFATIFVTFVYTIAGSWKWGGGWLDQMGFYDFAGSTLVHSVGGWGALVGAIILGPRLGKYTKEGLKPMLGHSLPLPTIGVFLLWLGWFGFNGGSVLSGDPGPVSFVLVTTSLAAAAGVIGAMLVSWMIFKKPDLTMVLNGALAGLVGITAGADVVSVMSAVVIGIVAGAIVVFSVTFFDSIKIDDPVGAISVHLVCGIWGTLAVGIFGGSDFSVVTQFIGVIAYGAFTVICSVILFLGIKMIMGLRVTQEEEMKGLDITEHGMEAYPDFQASV
ncbi:MAG: ammonium transporter [Candidatus Dadabacteria bacterium]|nr:ammonium transporter [Candidatus Dadabacteria bacterium]NIQ16499.1 ammonium transporter [Candidatus Dadabacteria bacterium]